MDKMNRFRRSLILLLSGDIEKNPGPQNLNSNIHNGNNNDWVIFRSRGIHLIHLNVNSLLPKIDEIRHIARLSNATVIGLTESKLDDSILDSEIIIEVYNILRSDRNRAGGGVACYVKNNICFDIKDFFDKKIEGLFFDILLQNSKPFSVGIVYRPPHDNDFLDILNENFHKMIPENKEIYILGDLNINILIGGKSILDNKFHANAKSNAGTLSVI